MKPNYKTWLIGQIEGELYDVSYDLERLCTKTLELLWKTIMGKDDPHKVFRYTKNLM